jgi:hypothetical protein
LILCPQKLEGIDRLAEFLHIRINTQGLKSGDFFDIVPHRSAGIDFFSLYLAYKCLMHKRLDGVSRYLDVRQGREPEASNDWTI